MELREKLLLLCQENLGNDDISEQANFFDIGCSSLTIYKISEQARERYGLNISPIDMMTYPTIEKLIAYLQEGEQALKGDNLGTAITARKNLRNRRQRG
ncbi:acyl carrier protein [Paenibacillus popilliae]|uniref:Acyl carrier protein n=1 Tax=Paenibacillus popilliae TaxID=78057 RepID=A0ABY3ARJ0_PAEPP|nr:acyl carrier protein [Paenibacillus sp. SDF0028]TQR45260.1 acyl carrier protein [Paenibacillus sp. SDF0028]